LPSYRGTAQQSGCLRVLPLRKWAALLIFRHSHSTHFDLENGGSIFFRNVRNPAHLKTASKHQNRINVNKGENLKWIRKEI
jgi:hypothetical protein